MFGAIYIIISIKSDDFLWLHTTWSFILSNHTHTFLLSALCCTTANAWQNCSFHFLFPVDLPALKQAILKQREIQMKCQVSRQCWLQEHSRLAGKGLPAALEGTQRLTGRKPQSSASAHGYRRSTIPSVVTLREHEIARHWKIQWGFVEHSKWDAFALGILSWSQSQWQHWLGSPSNLSWISSAKDSDMKLGWAHSIPNGTLAWVPLCLPVGEVGGKPVTGPFIHHLNLSWVRSGASHEVSDAEMNRSVPALEKQQNLQGRWPWEYFFDDSILRVTNMPCTGHRVEGTWCPKAPIQTSSWKVPVASN